MDDYLRVADDAAHALALGGVERLPDQKRAAVEFEAYLLKLLVSELRKTVPSGGLFEGRTTRGYQALLDDALARQIAERGAFGLAEQLLRQWSPEP